MEISKLNWIPLIIGFFSGGAFGALIKQFFDNRRNHIQSIGQTIEIKSFYDSDVNSLLTSQIILSGDSKEYKFSKLYTGTIRILNSGLTDYSEFTLGITCPENVKIIYIKPISTDRHHNVVFIQTPNLENQISSFDLILKPFNRKDIYSFDILLTTNDNTEILPEDIQLSSPHPVKWIEIVTTSKMILEVAKLITIGPISFRLR